MNTQNETTTPTNETLDYVNWAALAELGLLARINHEILHPLGYAAFYVVENGTSPGALIAESGCWCFTPEQMNLRGLKSGGMAVDFGSDPTMLEQYRRMFYAACGALGEISDALGLNPHEGGAAPILAAIEQLREQVAGPWMNAQDMKALQRVEECFEDGEGYDVPKLLMRRLAEIGAVRHLARGACEITAFGRYVLGSAHSRKPLETIDECNARLGREHRAAGIARTPQKQ